MLKIKYRSVFEAAGILRDKSFVKSSFLIVLFKDVPEIKWL